jgi:electron transfer flavoprotein alpha subunit
MSILVVAEHDNASIKGATLNTVAAAQKIGGDITVLVAGQDCGNAAAAAAKIAGVAKVLVADNAAYAHQLAENIGLASSMSWRRRPATARILCRALPRCWM